ncbi:hypothetical protein [Streptomyces sp. NPDC002779]|uniref:hypothetical protein n=1 Tax=Streptomyces sp. NPDC002779 TaxID=3364664 RepID=UPI00369B16AA
MRLPTEILSVVRHTGATTVYVTHDQAEAMALGDRVAVLRDGVLQQIGAPDELYDLPANAFVASFVGTPRINLAHGTLYAPIDGAMETLRGALPHRPRRHPRCPTTTESANSSCAPARQRAAGPGTASPSSSTCGR